MNILRFPDRRVSRVTGRYPISPTAPAWVLTVVMALNHSRTPDGAWRARPLLQYQLGESIPGQFIVLNRDYRVIGDTERRASGAYYGGFHVNQTHYDVARRAGWIDSGGYFFGDNPWDSDVALRTYREKIEGFIAPWTVLQGEMST